MQKRKWALMGLVLLGLAIPAVVARAACLYIGGKTLTIGHARARVNSSGSNSYAVNAYYNSFNGELNFAWGKLIGQLNTGDYYNINIVGVIEDTAPNAQRDFTVAINFRAMSPVSGDPCGGTVQGGPWTSSFHWNTGMDGGEGVLFGQVYPQANALGAANINAFVQTYNNGLLTATEGSCWAVNQGPVGKCGLP